MRFKEFEVINELDMLDVAKLLGMPDMPTEPAQKATAATPKIASVTDKKPTSDEKTAPEMDKSTTKSEKIPVNAAAISRYLTSKGLDDAHRLGLLANIKGESSFNSATYVIDSNGLPSGGLFQHNGPRFKQMVNAVGKDWQSNWQGQIDFALSEKEGRDYLKTPFKNAAEATAWWVKYFERPKFLAKDTNTRIGYLKNFA